MERRYLEITEETKARLGFYADLPPNPVEFDVEEWYFKEGDVLTGKPDPDTGTVKGDIVVALANNVKGEVPIDAQKWEIGARIIKILIPVGETIKVDLRETPLRLAELEVGDGSGGDFDADVIEEQNEDGKDEHPGESVEDRKSDEPGGSDESDDEPNSFVRVTPLAQRAAEELKVDLEDVRARLAGDVQELTAEHVEQFVKENQKSQVRVRVAPATKRRAKELGVDLTEITPESPTGIVKLQEVEEFAQRSKESPVETERETTSEETPEIDWGEFEVVKPTMRRRITARYMKEAWGEPHASPGIDINPIPLIELRKSMKEEFERLHGLKLRFDHFFIAACAWLLKQDEFRILNADWYVFEEEDAKPEIRLYRHVNVGIASAIPPDKTRSGFSELVVPSLKGAENMSFVEIVKEAERLIADAVEGHPKTEDQMYFTFIVNNTGSPVQWKGMVFAGDEFPDPIFPKATSAILAFGAARDEGGEKRMRLVLRFDHQICDGYEPKLFLRALQYLIEHPEQILTLT